MPSNACHPMKTRYFHPLILFLVPTIIGSACLWPPSAVEPVAISGFVFMLFSMVLTYISGIRLVLRDCGQRLSAGPVSRPASPTRL